MMMMMMMMMIMMMMRKNCFCSMVDRFLALFPSEIFDTARAVLEPAQSVAVVITTTPRYHYNIVV